MKHLLEYLASLKTGHLSDTGDLKRQLAVCWDELAGSEEKGMSGYKLGGRMEAVH